MFHSNEDNSSQTMLLRFKKLIIVLLKNLRYDIQLTNFRNSFNISKPVFITFLTFYKFIIVSRSPTNLKNVDTKVYKTLSIQLRLIK